MNCQSCGKPLPQASTLKRERPYGNNAQKKASEHLLQLQEARVRIRLLERLILRAGLTLPTRIKRAEPRELWDFVAKHNVARTPVQGVIEQNMLKPKPGDGGGLMLDAEGQCSFWQIFHDVGPWRTCPDCPHDEETLVE